MSLHEREDEQENAYTNRNSFIVSFRYVSIVEDTAGTTDTFLKICLHKETTNKM